MKNKQSTKPELLAPAGSLECAITAYECGADAVYAGLKRFNICDEDNGLSFEEMSKLSAYAKAKGKKFYVTMNSIVSESEITKVAKYLARLSELDPDALIVQDIGIARLARKIMPKTALHASSQMAIHNRAGIEQAHSLGIERVTLERGVKLNELELIVDKSPLDIEIFIHGALSSSLAGNSIWSTWSGDATGNMGNEEKISRRRFHGKENNEKKSGFFFSTNDMYTLDLMPKLSKMNIKSFKIEGRMKSPDYIKNVVTAYRMMLDVEKGEISKTLKEAKKILTTALGRKWSHGFLAEQGTDSLIQYDDLGLAGQLCGNVVQSNEQGFAIEVTRRLQKGDTVSILNPAGDVTDTIAITSMSSERKPTLTVRKGERVFIACDNQVPKDGTVYKVGSLMKDRTAMIAALPLYQQNVPLDLQVGAYPNGMSVKLLSHPDQPVWESDVYLEPALNKVLDQQMLIDSFSESGNPKYTLGNLSAKLKRELFIPAGTLKKERRAFWEWAVTQMNSYDPKPEGKVLMSEFIKEYKSFEPADASNEKEASLVVPKGNLPKKKQTMLVRSVFECNKKTDEVSLPHFCREERIGELERRIKEAYDLGIRRFRITSLYQVQLLKQYDDIVKISAYPLPVLNSLATCELKDYGFSRVQAWVGLDENQFNALIGHSQLPVEILRFGRPFLYATRADIHIEGLIGDDNGVEFNVVRNKKIGINYVFPIDVLSIPKIENSIDFFDLSYAWWNEKNTTSFNFSNEDKASDERNSD